VAAVVAVVVLVIFGGASLLTSGSGDSANDPVPTLPSVSVPASPDHPLQGTWVATDADGSTPTMTVQVAEDGVVEIVVLDDLASVCSGAPSTMTGTGRLEGETVLVIPAPVLTCDDGTEPQALNGADLEEILRNLTFTQDTVNDTLRDNIGSLWTREGVEDPNPPPTVATAMWPQSNLEEVQEAQVLADAGDPDYTWQVGGQLTEPYEHIELNLVDRFIREVLGWEAYMFNGLEGEFDASVDGGGGWVDGALLTDQRYLRCAPGRTNPLYPPQPGSDEPGESCAPTLDNLRYESVSIDLAQLDRQGRDGIWVVSRWELTAPFAQVDPVPVEAQATDRLEEFLAARIAGNGAEGLVPANPEVDVALLYATTTGAAYERYEIERVGGPWWPYASMKFEARLFADGDVTVVEQQIVWSGGALWLDINTTTENGQPAVLSYTSSDGEATVSAPSTWEMYWPDAAGRADSGVWFGSMRRTEELFGSDYRIGFVDPVAYDAWCAANGGSPLLSAPADAAAIAQQVIADPNFATTALVAARVGGVEAVSIDVSLAPGGEACGIGMIEISRWIHELWEPGLRLRLYLLDLPEGMSVQTLAITVVAPEERFEEVIAETAPIIESIEFHPG
jgi:hypothetical protein